MENNLIDKWDFVRNKTKELLDAGLISEYVFIEVDNAIDAELEKNGINTSETDL